MNDFFLRCIQTYLAWNQMRNVYLHLLSQPHNSHANSTTDGYKSFLQFADAEWLGRWAVTAAKKCSHVVVARQWHWIFILIFNIFQYVDIELLSLYQHCNATVYHRQPLLLGLFTSGFDLLLSIMFEKHEKSNCLQRLCALWAAWLAEVSELAAVENTIE